MPTPPRILRKHAADADHSLRDLSWKEIQREERIIAMATHLIARFGLAGVTFTDLAVAIKIAPTTLRRHFTDMDALTGEIIRLHFNTIFDALSAVPHGVPDRRRKLRAAYINATRVLGAPTEPQLIHTTCRAGLSEDERCNVEDVRAQIGLILCPEAPEAALVLLDSPWFDAEDVEALLQAYRERAAEREACAPSPWIDPDPEPAPETAPAATPGEPPAQNPMPRPARAVHPAPLLLPPPEGAGPPPPSPGGPGARPWQSGSRAPPQEAAA
jgi:AcrR family transcriptional regulator